jgi:TPR repeat protein
MTEFQDSLETLSLDQLRSLVAQDNPAIEYEIGRRFLEGTGVAQDFKAALSAFQRAAGKEYAPAEFELGRAWNRWGWLELTTSAAMHTFISVVLEGGYPRRSTVDDHRRHGV